MATVRVDIDIPAEPERVFDALVDLECYERWVSGHEGWPDGPPELREGTVFRQRMRLMRWTGDMEWTIAELQAPSHIALEGRGALGVRGRTRYELKGSDRGTNLHVTSEFGGGPASGAMRAVVTRKVQAACEESLARLSELIAEEPSPARASPLKATRRRSKRRPRRGVASAPVPVTATAPRRPPALLPIRYGLGVARMGLRLADPGRLWRAGARLLEPVLPR
ncbi:MAG TPA: SRPBCC family protein [Solirubrobacteraceae bacterium]|nr:SRPBCC family protein [Solirubrobacteraceae bacterium]